jgi:hypothetical protein
MALRNGTEYLTPDQRALARALRDAARIVGHAALPAEYRAAAFCYVAPRLVAGAGNDPPDRQPLTPGPSW